MQSAGNFVGGRIKFSAGVQRGHHHLRRGNFLAVDHHVVDGNAAPVVDHRDRVVEVNRDFNLGGESGERFVDGIVDHFVHQVMQTKFARRPDVHGGTLAHRFHAAQHLDGIGVVVAVAAVACAVRRVIGVTFPFFVLVSTMGVLISLVAIPLRENVPIFSRELGLANSWNFGWNLRSIRALLKTPVKRLQVIEIPNT